MPVGAIIRRQESRVLTEKQANVAWLESAFTEEIKMVRALTKCLELLVLWLIAVYFFVAFIIVPYYNWRYASENGFLKWLLLGEIVPTYQGLVWPYTIYTDYRHAQEVAAENSSRERYARQLAEAEAPYDALITRLEPAMNKANILLAASQQSLDLRRRREAIKLWARISREMVKADNEYVVRFAAITPPSSMRKFHVVALEFHRVMLRYFKSASARAEQGDIEGAREVLLRALLDPQIADLAGRMKAEAESAHLNVPKPPWAAGPWSRNQGGT